MFCCWFQAEICSKTTNMKTLVLYYSKKGSNKYLAEKIAQRLHGDLEAIRPRWDAQYMLMLGVHFGNKKLQADVSRYERVILCGPIWVGQLIAPLKSFIRQYYEKIGQLVFVTCCGSSYEQKDEKFGHGLVFNQVRQLLPDIPVTCQAFPISLVMPEGKKEDGELMMKTHLNDDNFKGEIAERFEVFVQDLEGVRTQVLELV